MMGRIVQLRGNQFYLRSFRTADAVILYRESSDLTHAESTGREFFLEPAERGFKSERERERENVKAGTGDVKDSANRRISLNLELLARCMTDSRHVRYLFQLLVIG